MSEIPRYSPAYSVVIPAYNASKYIAETIQSVMAQSHPPEAIIIVDDGSTDRLSQVLMPLTAPITLIRQKNSGPGSATTRGVQLVKTEFLAMVDADDLWQPDKITQQFAAMRDNSAEMVFTNMEPFGDDIGGATTNTAHAGWSRSTLLMRLDTFARIGPINDMPGYRGEMVAWIARARALDVRITMLETVLARRRLHKGSLSWKRDPAKDAGYMEVVREAMRRRKESQK